MTENGKRAARPVIVWFRDDLRLRDNQALLAAERHGGAVIPLYIHDNESNGLRPLGGARRWWLHHSLEQLAGALARKGASLILRRGKAADVLAELVQESGACAVYWNRRYDPPASALDTQIKKTLTIRGLECRSFDGQLLHEPTRLRTGQGDPYKVYTPFWKAFVASGEPREPEPEPDTLIGYPAKLRSDLLSTWGLLPQRPDWAGGLREEWTPGEAGAQARLASFLAGAIEGYRDGRDFPGTVSTSRLSPHLAFGEISPFDVWHAAGRAAGRAAPRDIEHFRKELCWREFSYHLLVNFPTLPTQNFDRRFDAFPWVRDDAALRQWQKGETGYPIVDAGMRELWATGWMHNRVRMICASFLIKDLRIDWREGEAWFWDTLVDADPASNAASWQWVAGSGADAAPYFRVFNPVLQGIKFDGRGDYVRQHVPALRSVPDDFVHKPWEAPRDSLRHTGVRLGVTYPRPMVDHAAARDHALQAYNDIKGAR